MFRTAVAIVVCLYLSSTALGEQNYPEIGEQCPDFLLRGIKYFPKKQASLKDFLGKWLVLDFWNKQCGACIASFPKTNQLQKTYGDKVQFMFVGVQDRENEIQRLYEKFRERQHLVVPCAFDSALANRFDIYTAPYIIIIDDKGVVRAITYSVNENNIQDFLAGKTPKLQRATRMHETDEDTHAIPYYPEKPFLVDGNGARDSDFIFRSVLSAWDPSINHEFGPSEINERSIINNRFQVLGVSVDMLYKYAYFGAKSWSYNDSLRYGKYFGVPILEVKDSSAFAYSYLEGKNLYSYSLTLPKSRATIDEFKKTMRRDLESYFGYDVSIEMRKFPYWRIIATDDAKIKLRSKGGTSSFDGVPKASFVARNWPFSKIVKLIKGYNQDIFLDETGISGNVDLSLDCILTDLDDLKRAFRGNGLDLVQGEKEMKVLVIRDQILR